MTRTIMAILLLASITLAGCTTDTPNPPAAQATPAALIFLNNADRTVWLWASNQTLGLDAQRDIDPGSAARFDQTPLRVGDTITLTIMAQWSDAEETHITHRGAVNVNSPSMYFVHDGTSIRCALENPNGNNCWA